MTAETLVAPTTGPVMNARGITVAYGDRTVVDRADFSVGANGTWTIVVMNNGNATVLNAEEARLADGNAAAPGNGQ